mmetsp:Transcript_71553/g.190308  ORF Transcript_71553/g.190308 Transcript_71553/m.190308 type:complete len:222 (-) Transcript_71553:118-783(-)|eukprot:CAMPEP_0171164704 /NCGR_PEP_ID=MMETSP0790-20130122/5807_1 /TAXON_ID=2925 /ORGANISM="Alexandrium catenella, Strain OF101" /LENGTH=221 /DNA_ID=CAMNT_0011629471 /DNA_START=88 /DNA_END=753 /DNA_ORIENTATION=-
MIAVGLLIAYCLFILVFAIGVCWLWPDFVDSTEPPRIRSVLHAILALQTVVELGVWSWGAVRPWVLAVVLLTNGWGMLDAFLRFPVVHGIDSLFGLKQVLLIIAKLTGYALGFRSVSRHVGWFVLLILVCVFTLPILWLTALPIGDLTSYHQKHDAVDVDVALRLWRVVSDPRDRAVAAAHGKLQCRRAVVALVHCLPFLKGPVLRLDPSLARTLRNKPAV